MEMLEGMPREVWVGDVTSSTALRSPPGGSAFALMLVAFGQASAPDMRRVARSLIDQGCRYAVCAGVDSGDWESAFDDADLQTNPNCEPDRFVTTTSHAAESLEEVATFLFSCTAIDGAEASRFVVATLDGDARDLSAVRAAVSHALMALPNQPLQRT